MRKLHLLLLLLSHQGLCGFLSELGLCGGVVQKGKHLWQCRAECTRTPFNSVLQRLGTAQRGRKPCRDGTRSGNSACACACASFSSMDRVVTAAGITSRCHGNAEQSISERVGWIRLANRSKPCFEIDRGERFKRNAVHRNRRIHFAHWRDFVCKNVNNINNVCSCF